MIDLQRDPNYHKIKPVNAVQIQRVDFHGNHPCCTKNQVTGVGYNPLTLIATIPLGMLLVFAKDEGQVGDWIVWDKQYMWICHDEDFERCYQEC